MPECVGVWEMSQKPDGSGLVAVACGLEKVLEGKIWPENSQEMQTKSLQKKELAQRKDAKGNANLD